MRGGVKHSPHMRTPEIHQKSSKINDLENEPGHVWRLPKVSGVTRDDIWHHETSQNNISRSRFSQDLQEFHKIVADCRHLWCDSEPGADIVGIYVENHEGRCREFFIWIQFAFSNLNFRGSWLPCLRMPRFLKLVPWRRVLRTTREIWTWHCNSDVVWA